MVLMTGLILCTDSFTLEDVCLLIGVLHYNFGFNCTLRKTKVNQYRIYIKTDSVHKLRDMVKHSIHPHFLYKIR